MKIRLTEFRQIIHEAVMKELDTTLVTAAQKDAKQLRKSLNALIKSRPKMNRARRQELTSSIDDIDNTLKAEFDSNG